MSISSKKIENVHDILTYLCISHSLGEFSHAIDIYIYIYICIVSFFSFSLTSHAADICHVSSSAVAMARMWWLL